ncbi:apolipoprotein N-acyltransferase [Demequina sp. NBRC 110051]|uniref:apolipoprotein N-acyltransferase n=1 Tax=Demequina sp. NBRC 110051 TaxID=1570340 RepID=UPI0009FC9CDB|nr:apolipoprotein N-acyltransferase [Demequina sp. NBRC 110051]
MPRFLTTMVLAVGGGLVMNAGFPDLGWWPLIYVSLAMLWLALAQATVWRGFLITWVFAISFLLPHLTWADASVGLVPWLALSIAEGAFIALFGAGWAAVRRSPLMEGRATWWSPLAFGLIWVGMEQLRSMIPFGGFPWGRIAFSQVDAPIARIAWLGGLPLTTLAVATVGACLGLAIEAMLTRRLVLAGVAPIAGAALFAAGLFVPIDTQATDGTLRVGAVQGNVPNTGLDAFSQARQVTKNHHDGTMALVESDPGPIDLLLWPENSSDYDPRADEESEQLVTASAQAAQAPLLLGTNDYSPEEGRYNSMLLWSTSGQVLDTYNKQRPAPFAEYIPMRSFVRNFSDAVDLVQTEVLEGEGKATIHVPVAALDRVVTVGTPICFEIAYDTIVTDAVADGAEALLVPTNNASFGLTAESTQQLQMTRFAAITTGRAAIQISTVGVSGVVTPNGRLIEETDLFTAEQIYTTLPLRTETTPAVGLRYLWHWGFLLTPAILVISAAGRTIRERYDW